MCVYIYIYILFVSEMEPEICKLFKFMCSNGSAKNYFFIKTLNRGGQHK